jgi:ubiquinone biosynthesis protein COQ4
MPQYSSGQKTFLGFGAAVLGLLNPWRSDMIELLSQVSSDSALRALRNKMAHTDQGRLILCEKPRLDSSVLGEQILKSLPDGSLGRVYLEFMQNRGFSPDSRSLNYSDIINDPELCYILERYRAQHDLWHVLLGLDTNVEGELAQKVFEYLQTGLPMCAISAIFGPIQLSSAQRKRLRQMYVPWAISCHQTSAFLMEIRLEDLLRDPLPNVRQRLGIVSFNDWIQSNR